MYTVITSTSNPTVKQLRGLLTSSKTRRDEQLFVAEGIHLVQSFLNSGELPERYIVAESALKNGEIAALAGQFAQLRIEQTVLADSLFASLTSLHAHVGIAVIFRPNKRAIPAELTETTVVFDDIQDPGNVGTMLRTIAAAGIRHVLLSPGCASPWSPKALRAGMGAQFGITVYEDVDVAHILSSAKLPIAATVLSETSVSLYDTDLKGPIIWLFGSEGQGLSDELASKATMRIHIPQHNDAIESLNVASAAAICIYEQYRQNRA